ncbi:MAG: DNA polymerase I [Prevotellaceae bacterium]|nr:DNA polymerase I [Prevotellaceae bacterium]
MDKLFLIDAYALIYRSYYAFLKNPRVNSKGLNTSAVFGFVNTLEDVLKRENPTHIAVAFDPAGKTFRHEAFEQYKAQRLQTPEDIKKAIPIIKQIIEAYGITMFEVEGYEADDVIGTLAKIAQNHDFDVYMMTPDKDYAQIVDTHIFQYKPRFGSTGFDTLGVEQIKQRYEIDNPLQMIDLLGLMGDASDNIPGCPGVGDKTATKLLKEFGSIENLLENTDKLKGTLKQKVEENREQIVFSKFLATIKTDVPLEFDKNKLLRQNLDLEKIKEIFTELEFRTLLAKVLPNQSFEQPKAIPNPSPQQQSLFGDEEPEYQTNIQQNGFEEIHKKYSSNNIQNTEHQYFIAQTEQEIDNLIKVLEKQNSFCFDTETTSLNTFEAQLVGLSFCCEPHKAYYVPVPEDQSVAEDIVTRFKPIFADKNILKIGQNIKYDMLVLANYGVEIGGQMFDTMIAHYLLQPELRHNMDYLAEILLDYQTIHYKEIVGANGKNQLSIRQVDIRKVANYAAEDADITLRLKELLEKQLKEQNLENLFYEIEMPLVKVLFRMEMNGMLIDDFALAKSSEILNNQLIQIERKIYELAGARINISSPKQIGELLFDKLRIVGKARKTKTGQYVTDEETLEYLKDRHPIVKLILEYRGLKKLLSTYTEALPKLIEAKTGKVHTSFNQTVASTGRLSSSNPNLQNIPVRDEQGREIRKAFIAQDGCVLISADYSQIELRIMAHLSGDRNMVAAFLSGQDIHAATAAKIFNVPISEVTSDMRRKAKTANFGIIYGISAFGLSERLGIPRYEAKDLIDGYFVSFPDVKTYIEKVIKNAQDTGFVQTILGRKRHLADINSRNANVRGFAERNAVNAPIQGTAADIIKIAMIKIDDELANLNLKTEMILQVHDELIFNVPNNELEIIKPIIINAMQNAAKLDVPLIVDAGTGQNWLEAH